MKTLLVGGPLDGKIVDVKRNVFGYSEVAEISNKSGEIIRTENSGMYLNSHQTMHHPCKKKGTVRTFTYTNKN